jgi:hypothetical protein
VLHLIGRGLPNVHARPTRQMRKRRLEAVLI